MSRRRRADKREVIPDPKFGDIVLTKFMNSIMKEGKKSALLLVSNGQGEVRFVAVSMN